MSGIASLPRLIRKRVGQPRAMIPLIERDGNEAFRLALAPCSTLLDPVVPITNDRRSHGLHAGLLLESRMK